MLAVRVGRPPRFSTDADLSDIALAKPDIAAGQAVRRSPPRLLRGLSLFPFGWLLASLLFLEHEHHFPVGIQLQSGCEGFPRLTAEAFEEASRLPG